MKKHVKSLMALLTLAALASCGGGGTDDSSSSIVEDSDPPASSSIEEHIHSYNRQAAEDKYLKTAATCVSKAVYYYSCECGERGSETFEYGDYAAHDLTKHDQVDATCTEAGTEEYYECTVCGKTFSDAEGKDEITQTVSIDPTGHDVDEDTGKCKACDADFYSSLVFTPNDAENPTSYTVKSTDTNVVSVTIPDTHKGLPVTGLEDSAFKDHTLLERIEIGQNVASIGKFAFENCAALNDVEIPGNVVSVGQDAFKNAVGLTKISIAPGLTQIPQGMFYYASNLKSIEIPEGVTSIGPGAFRGCYRLRSVTIPESMASIDTKNAFMDCFNLVEIKNLSALAIKNETDDDKSAYGGLTYYSKNIYTGTEGSSILQSVGDWTFYTIKTEDAETKEIVEEKYLLGYDGDEEMTATPTEEEVGSTYKIPDYAFRNDTKIKDLTISDGATSIGYTSFMKSSLKSVYISDSVTDYGRNGNGFNRTSLTKIRLSEKASTISSGFLYYSASLESIVIPKAVTNVAKQAFDRTAALKTVYYGGSSEADWSKISMSDGNENLQNATRYYYSEEEPAENKGAYWHYDADGITPVLWEAAA